MKQTIGELVRYILPYANQLEISTVNDIPFMRCILSGRTKMGKSYVYIIQMNEHQYAMCDNDDDLLGERYFPTGNISRPFVTEKDIVSNWFGPQRDTSTYDMVKINLSVNDVVDNLYNILSYYDIIRFDLKKKYDLPIATSMEIGRARLRNAISCIFSEKGKPSGTFRDLVDIVIKNDDKIDLGMLRDRDIQHIKTKMRDYHGIEITIKNNCIVDVIFEKQA